MGVYTTESGYRPGNIYLFVIKRVATGNTISNSNIVLTPTNNIEWRGSDNSLIIIFT